MKIFVVIVQIVLTLQLQHKVFGFLVPRTTTADRIRNFGYSSESHNVVTKDGYILSMFRVKNITLTTQGPKPVVLMIHGLTSSSDIFIIRGAKDALAFNLVDAGYDVWLANCRGNTYSNRHLTLSTNDRRYWQYSWDVMAVNDLPMFIDYVLKMTQQASLHYVGHSQGTAIMFALLSQQPRYNKKLKTTHMFAPIAYMRYAQSMAIRLSAPLLGTYGPLDPLYGDRAFLQNPLFLQLSGIAKCRSPLTFPGICAFWVGVAGGFTNHTSESLYPEIFNTHPSPSSAHQFIHLVQLYVSGHFRSYDYGLQGNMKRYNRTTPPDYRVENINPKFPINLYYSDYDVLSSKRDSEHFSAILGKRSVRHFIDVPNFNHFDFLWSIKVKETINRGVLQRINEAEALLAKT
uniref:Lipase n=1 Tax=Stomoxys calcitrans TaxID=35570 RepID=A0A1I8PL70_STOCA